MHEDHPIKVSDVETGPGAEKLKTLKERLATAHVAGFFKSADDLRAQVIHALTALKTGQAVKVPAAGLRTSAVLLTVNVAGAKRSSRCSRMGLDGGRRNGRRPAAHP